MFLLRRNNTINIIVRKTVHIYIRKRSTAWQLFKSLNTSSFDYTNDGFKETEGENVIKKTSQVLKKTVDEIHE